MKNRTMLLLTTIITLFVLSPLIGSVNALQVGPGGPNDPPMNPDKMPDHESDSNGSIMIHTDIITIMANDEFPSFHFWFSSDEDAEIAKFMLSYISIAEFEDQNGDDAFQQDETLNFAPLSAYDWVLQVGKITEGDITTEVWLKYTKGGIRTEGPLSGFDPAMEGPGSVRTYSDVSIQIWAHIYLDDYSGVVTDDSGVKANFTVAGGSELKMDILIGNFPFSTDTSSVSLQTLLRENGASGEMHQNRHRYVTREQTRNVTGDSNNPDANMTQGEVMFMNRIENSTQKIDFIDSESDEVEGFFSWLDKAVITWPGGETEAVDVTTSYKPTLDGLALYLAYPNFDSGSILHDPSIGLIEDSVPLSITDSLTNLYLILGIGAIAIVVLGVAIIRKK